MLKDNRGERVQVEANGAACTLMLTVHYSVVGGEGNIKERVMSKKVLFRKFRYWLSDSKDAFWRIPGGGFLHKRLWRLACWQKS